MRGGVISTQNPPTCAIALRSRWLLVVVESRTSQIIFVHCTVSVMVFVAASKDPSDWMMDIPRGNGTLLARIHHQTRTVVPAGRTGNRYPGLEPHDQPPAGAGSTICVRHTGRPSGPFSPVNQDVETVVPTGTWAALVLVVVRS